MCYTVSVVLYVVSSGVSCNHHAKDDGGLNKTCSIFTSTRIQFSANGFDYDREIAVFSFSTDSLRHIKVRADWSHPVEVCHRFSLN